MGEEAKTLMAIVKKFKWLIALLVVGLGGIFLVVVLVGSTSQPGCSTNTPDTTGSIPTSASKAKNAKATYDQLRSFGATPSAAAGIMGVLDFESSFNPAISNTGGSGAFGLAQWMGNRRTNLMAFAAEHSLKADTLEAQLKFMKHELDTSYGGVKSIFKETNVHKACYDWLMDYEGMRNNPEQWFLEKGPSGQPGRYPRADSWYAKFGENDTSNGTNTSDGTSTADGSNDETTSACQTNDQASDGSGKVPSDLPYGQNIAANKIPDDVKSFLLPNQLSDARGLSGKSWSHPGDQCVDYSVSRISALWGLPSWTGGNGGDQAQAVIGMGGKKETSPHAGDIGSSQGFPPTPSAEPGHTWIIEHVFADGSVLLSEQNGPESGAYIHMPKTWSIILMHPYPDGKEWKTANGGEYQPIPSGKATFARPKGTMKK